MLDKNIEINRELIHVMDELLATGDWNASLFLRTTSKKLSELRNQAQTLLNEAMGVVSVNQQGHDTFAKAGHIQVYVSLYQTDGNNMQKWQATLKSLNDFSASRPVYENEAHVQAMIRAKSEVVREAYAVILVAEKDIMPMTQQQADRLGHPLTTLKMGAIKQENIVEFVHCQQRYRVFEGNLVLNKQALVR